MLEEPLDKPKSSGPSDLGMETPSFLRNFLLLDLEARGKRIRRIGAILNGRVFEAAGRFDGKRAPADLDRFGKEAEGILGHNVLDFDSSVIAGIAPGLELLRKPVIDTLFLSPLAFPENPYHRLVKDYKLVRDSLGDPVADARLALSVFVDQWRSFGQTAADGHGDILSFYRFCFESEPGVVDNPYRGLASVFERLGTVRMDESRAVRVLEKNVADRVCGTSLRDVLLPAAGNPDIRPALAYILAWLRVAGSNSVIPPWVRKRFPAVGEMLGLLRSIPCNDPECAYCVENFSPKEQLERFFGFSDFRPHPADRDGKSLQEKIVTAGMKDEPLLAILPTGGGKSLCYQLPALARYHRLGSLTIVISPLQALMKDQTDNLAEKTGTPYAAAINGLLTPPERGETLERVRLGDVAILYVAPEQLRNRSFRQAIAQREIGAWVFDEAHCLSKWGHDFRPDYLYAGRFIREHSTSSGAPVPPVECFTATARMDVKEEILEFFRRELSQDLGLFEGSIERENLRFEVRAVRKAEKYSAIHEILIDRLSASPTGSAIVYAATRRGAEEIADFLNSRDFAGAVFHGGLNAVEKRAAQEAFLSGSVRAIAATNAFGMGIDKGDVRLVLHADIPGSLESYIQEAGRAGRDLRDAECMLLYDETDVETQFKLGALSKLSRRDVAQILRGIRKASRSRSGEIIITAGELLRDEDVETSFDLEDLQAETKVRTALAWLERSSFIERNENHTRVFQGKLLVRNIEEAREKISRLNLSSIQENHWLSIVSAMINADSDEALSADRLAELAGIPEPKGDVEIESAEGGESASQRVLRVLHGMSEAGILNRGVMLTAYVRHKVKSPSLQILKEVSALEDDMLKILGEEDPDAAEMGWQPLSLRALNQKLKELGHESNPEILRGLLKSIALDGKGLAGSRGSLQYRHLRQDQYLVKLLRSWDALVETSKIRRAVAHVLLDKILSGVGPGEAPSADLLVSFSTDDLAGALKSHLYLSRLKDPLAAIDRALLYMHEQKALILQQGLAVFRQAMSVKILPEAGRRRYSKSDYEPLERHYREKVLQVHVMNEYARLGVEEISRALELVLAYFTLDRASFIKRYFPGRKYVVTRATGEDSQRRIVVDLGNPAQMRIVSSSDEENLLVLAGPGSGKTRVVVHRCAYLVRVLRVRPESILIVCFNHGAAVSLRKRLFELLGEDARGVIVQTYHGMAMRITGTCFADAIEKNRDDELPFDRLIPDAVRLLKGETNLAGAPSDELRDRLLSNFRHILVDEYQDIDREQYDLISALAGRKENDPDARLTILAVGDDDQNVYAFRGANVRFIKRFQEDYNARTEYLVENYRSTLNIVKAANALISFNRDRMKTDRPIRPNRQREGDPPGGRWEEIDPLVRGRAQILEISGALEQASSLLCEWKRMRDLDRELQWTDIAVLSRTRESLAAVRAACEHHDIPVSWGLSRARGSSLTRVREIARFLDLLKSKKREVLRASDLEPLLVEIFGGPGVNPWRALLGEFVSAWKAESADAELPVSHAVGWIYECLAERRREQRLGFGVFLSTVHGAKGLEFPHVFILDGDWRKAKSRAEAEEERRVFYVAATRAGETLSIFRRSDAPNPNLAGLEGDFLLRRKAGPGVGLPEEVVRLRYELLGMKDVDLGYAGRLGPDDPVHKALASLEPGTILAAKAEGGQVVLIGPLGESVARLSRKGSKSWLPRLPAVRRVRVVGMIERGREDEADGFKELCGTERWEVPWVEAVFEVGGVNKA